MFSSPFKKLAKPDLFLNSFSTPEALSQAVHDYIEENGIPYQKNPCRMRKPTLEEIGIELVTFVDTRDGGIKEETRKTITEDLVLVTNGALNNDPNILNEYCMTIAKAEKVYDIECSSLTYEYKDTEVQKVDSFKTIKISADWLKYLRNQSSLLGIEQAEDELYAKIPCAWGTMDVDFDGLLVADVDGKHFYGIASTQLPFYSHLVSTSEESTTYRRSFGYDPKAAAAVYAEAQDGYRRNRGF